MSKTAKIIKYLSLAFAFFLIISIFSGLAYCVEGIFNIFYEKEIEGVSAIDTYLNVNQLDIDIVSSNLVIKKGTKLEVQTNNPNISCYQEGKNLKIEENNYNWFKNNKETDLTISIPDNVLNSMNIKTGAGIVNIDYLKTNNLNLKLGAGKIEITYIESFEETKIETGAGAVEIKNSKFHDLDFDMGVGEVIMSSAITGDSEINSGIGSLNLHLLGSFSDYKIAVDKGIGEVLIDNKTVNDKDIIGSGNNQLELDSGIGKVVVNFEK